MSDTLPPLPEPYEALELWGQNLNVYDERQMCSYAAAALAAERERQHEQMRQLMSELIFDEPAALAEPDVPETRFGNMPERLRIYSADTELSDRYSDAMQEAADEIERLTAALAAAVAEPLTDEQIDAMYSASYRTRESDYATNWYWYERGIREGERAHGITKEAP